MLKEETLVKSSTLSWISVSDLPRAKAFFADLLGLTVLEQSDEFGWMELGGEEGARIGIALSPSGEGELKPGENAVITLNVNKIEEVIQDLKGKGVEFIGDVIEVPNVVKMIFFKDPDGNKFQLVEEIV